MISLLVVCVDVTQGTKDNWQVPRDVSFLRIITYSISKLPDTVFVVASFILIEFQFTSCSKRFGELERAVRQMSDPLPCDTLITPLQPMVKF